MLVLLRDCLSISNVHTFVLSFRRILNSFSTPVFVGYRYAAVTIGRRALFSILQLSTHSVPKSGRTPGWYSEWLTSRSLGIGLNGIQDQ